MITAFQLAAVATHVGSLTEGHYEACVQRGGLWWRASDCDISVGTVAPPLGLERSAYALFLVRRACNGGGRPLGPPLVDWGFAR